MENLTGPWILWQEWEGVVSYYFEINFNEDGTITIPGAPYFYGTYVQLEDSNEISLAIGQFEGVQSITSYVGIAAGNVMGGQMQGVEVLQSGASGSWGATRIPILDLEKKNPGVGK